MRLPSFSVIPAMLLNLMLFHEDSVELGSLHEGPSELGSLHEGPSELGSLHEGPSELGSFHEGPSELGSFNEGPLIVCPPASFVSILKSGIDRGIGLEAKM